MHGVVARPTGSAERPTTSAAPGALPRSLKALGNHEAWGRVEARVRLHPRHVLVLHGPTGCGKTEGIRSLARTMGRRLVEFDGSDPEFPHELVRWVRDTRLSCGMRGECMLLLDDFESFTTQARREVARLLLGQERDTDADARGAHLCPIVITCTQLRHPDMRDLLPFHAERLRAPAARQISEWFAHAPVAVECRDGSTQHVVASAEWLRCQGDLCATGDLRRVANAIRWEHGADFKRTESEVEAARRTRAPPANVFEATRSLFLRQPLAVERWTHLAEERDMNLLREHLPRYASTQAALADALDAFSAVDHRPDRFELHAAHLPHSLHVAALATSLTSRTRDVGALAPPPRLAAATDRAPSTPGTRPMTTSEWLDVPALLRDSS